MLKFGVKVGVCAGAGYYLSQEGVWGDSTESLKFYNKIKEASKPYVKDLTTQMNIEIPDLPNSDCISYATKQCWNAGVTKTFEFLKDLPEHTCEWTDKGWKAVNGNPEIKKFIDSFTAPPALPEKK
ncbi:PREDICTED: MICOS complex subunit MIC13 homolog QIL1 [Nicrophorus vespilloides]|uniref:MICOS complex subunit MIC13 n=1 Tax=Nicrophorus vespilloides TaxID=110193 RepID=A0ABM1N3Y5_NICVS|nr:PREDICTED: MICOS complex subunit MIC13 homolog QIL1 [Nicrophorus vespilloides]